jgi:hypothetical protein
MLQGSRLEQSSAASEVAHLAGLRLEFRARHPFFGQEVGIILPNLPKNRKIVVDEKTKNLV